MLRFEGEEEVRINIFATTVSLHLVPMVTQMRYNYWTIEVQKAPQKQGKLSTPPRLRDIRSICVISASYYPFIGL